MFIWDNDTHHLSRTVCAICKRGMLRTLLLRISGYCGPPFHKCWNGENELVTIVCTILLYHVKKYVF